MTSRGNILHNMWYCVKIFAVLVCLPFGEGQIEGDLRLVGNSGKGRLEIYHNSTWGTICDDFFGIPDAHVACRQLGYRTSNITVYRPERGINQIWLDNVRCSGFERRLDECNHAGWGNHNCGHYEDVGINCGAENGDLRLVGNSGKGRLEIYHNTTWGTICDNHFGIPDARVACRQLGHVVYRTSNITVYRAARGINQIWLDDVRCSGFERRLDECNHAGWGNHNCGHYEDVGINCGAENGDLQLVGNSGKGRLEIYYNTTWGTICDDFFGIPDALVACRQLGYRTSNITVYRPERGINQIWLDNVRCSGFERRLDECNHAGWGRHNCGHNEDVGINCGAENDGHWGSWTAWTMCNASCDSGYQSRNRLCNNPAPSFNGSYCDGESFEVLNCSLTQCPGDLRLVGNSGKGRLEIYHNTTWGTICGDFFGIPDALVACRQLGYRTSNITVYRPERGINQIWLDDVRCSGFERRLDECNHAGWGNHNCGHNEDVGINCGAENVDGHWGSWTAWTMCNASCDSGYQSRNRLCNNPAPSFNGSYCDGESFEVLNCSLTKCPVLGDLRLVGNSGKGRLEIYHKSTWGTICDDLFGISEALVACRQLGYRKSDVTVYRPERGTNQIWLDNVICSGLERRLDQCNHAGWGNHNCFHHEDVGINCKADHD